MITAGRHREQGGQWETAAEYYSKAIEMDNLAEEFYRRLMLCCQMLGRRTEAAALYKRCRSRLYTELGIEPSVETEAVYASIMQKQ
jgi:DNA-binding SARP family transcriptional activator